ncbi:MAG TPA: SDR family NAD(P)-dependent oxidoreductase [Nitrolancea sp.]|jgi:short-subunit dehydrogenase|nr:SDR family NAD(P)-dependent oxidoreductase [Nitrolancea sp.]
MPIVRGNSKIIVVLGLGLAGRAIVKRRRRFDLRGNVVLITGSSRGLGLAMAEEFARHGANLVLCARDAGGLEWARQTVSRHGTDVLTVPCDISDHDQVQALIQRAVERFGRIDILVNNAGIITVGPVQEQTLTDFETSMDIMFWGVVRPTLAVLPQMLQRQEGHIVNITSIGGAVSVPHLLSYSSAKFAAVGFSEGLSAEVARDGVHVLTVVPGLMRTGSHVNALFKGQNRAEYSWFSLGASLPLTSISAQNAARQIVAAVQRGESHIILSPQAQLLARFHGMFPGLTANILGMINQALPDPGGIGTERRLGKESRSAISESFLTALGRRAADTWHQSPRPPESQDHAAN